MNSETLAVFETLHAQHSGMVRQVCLGFMKGDREMASDLVQEVFINVWNNLGKFRNEASYKTWIYRITVNTCLQQIRKENNKLVRKEEHDVADDAENEDEAKQNLLYKSIGQLSAIDRLIIMMVLDELPYDEIGKTVGIKEGNLRVKIHRIKERLKKLMDENE